MNSLKLLYVVSAATLMFCSCINQKYLAKNQVVFKVEDAGNNKNEIKAYRTGQNIIHVNLLNVNGTLLITKDSAETQNFTLPTVVVTKTDTSSRYTQLKLQNKYYYPETFYPQPGDSNSNQVFKIPPKLKFAENHWVLQIITVPLKVRTGITNNKFKDSLPTQALAELNLGAAFGIKRTWTAFRARASDEGVNVVNTSFACTGFVSFGGTNLKPLTTRYSIPYEKTEYVGSYGVNFLFGFYNLNIGFSIGADQLVNRSLASKWIFNGSAWYGVTVAYDILR